MAIVWQMFVFFVTAISGRPKPELCFFPGRCLPKERYGNSLSGRGSNSQPSNWEADTLLLYYGGRCLGY